MRTFSTTCESPSRRSVLVGAAVVGAAASVPLAGQSAAATTAARPTRPSRAAYVVPKTRTVDVPEAATRHVLTRFTTGVNKARLAEVAAAGDIDAWFDEQLRPGDIPDHKAAATWAWFPVLALSPYQKWQRYKSGAEQGWEMMQDLASWTMLRRYVTKRQLQEMMVDFWSNLLHVPSPADEAWVYRVEYQEMVRRNALGSFADLLNEAITHPCMGLYLNNVESTADGINENLGRELLECHTVGLGAGYTQQDVVSSARILTGFHVDRRQSWEATYVPADHWVGHVKVLGFSAPNTDPDGRAVLDRYLRYLAHHPSTAQRLCRRLAVRFVSDTPSDALVDTLAQVYLDSGTSIVPVLRALVASQEFKGSALLKVRTPVEDALATWNALQADVAQPRQEHDAGNQFINVSKAIGQVVYDWPAPNGFPDVAPAWTGAGRILGSMRTHWYASGGYWPNQGIAFPTVMDWMPRLPTTFDKVVDHVVGSVLFMPSTSTMLEAACAATDISPTDVIDESHALVTFKLPRLMVSILDTPEHLSR